MEKLIQDFKLIGYDLGLEESSTGWVVFTYQEKNSIEHVEINIISSECRGLIEDYQNRFTTEVDLRDEELNIIKRFFNRQAKGETQ